MSYLVLARKWRPKGFGDVVGQKHIVRTLSNALDSGRLHHAFLFSGTRGTGKTTLARIVARCLNCEAGVSSKPCGVCAACEEIDQGRFVDLIEVDAASRTKVDDTRELLDNVQYSPTRGRYKVYLIDEVHMLSGHSFNALLKTLEEPPDHVKFLLATTDPQKLPVTVLSRCLQLNLKRVAPDATRDRLATILDAERIAYDGSALAALAGAADGSLRDALSLLDQAIAYGHGEVRDEPVREMLGTIDQKAVATILDALAEGKADRVLASIAEIAEFNPDYDDLLKEILLALHGIAIAQIAGDTPDGGYRRGRFSLAAYTGRFSREDVQLFYQIGMMGRRDLAFAPDLRAGAEMTLLRMLAFRPAEPVSFEAPATRRVPVAQDVPTRVARPVDPPPSPMTSVAAGPTRDAGDLVGHWAETVAEIGASGLMRELLGNSVAMADGERLLLTVDPTCGHLLTKDRVMAIKELLERYCGRSLDVDLRTGTADQDSPAKRRRVEQETRQQSVTQTLMNDPIVRQFQDQFGARINPASIKPKA